MSEDDPQREADFKHLKWSLQALAAAGSAQAALFPDHALKADALAFDFERRAAVVRSRHERELTVDQADALRAIMEKLAVIARDGSEFEVEVWTDDALRSSEHWAEVRRLAASALEAFGWTAVPTSGS